MNQTTDAERQMLRHTVATLAYRAAKVLRDAPVSFPTMKISDTSRTPVQILAHIGDLLDWALSLAEGEHVWHDSTPGPWDNEVTRFFAALRRFDAFLASGNLLKASSEKLFQGPIADALTHIGQIALMRRAGGSPIRGENYFKADIAIGRTGPEQSNKRAEFD